METSPAAPPAGSPTKRARPVDESDDAKEDYPYDVEEADHCETPAAAYEHVAPVLRMLAALCGRTPASLRIYDPYYCEGGVVRRLGEQGFHRVYNAREDFYAVRCDGVGGMQRLRSRHSPAAGNRAGQGTGA